MGFIKKILYLLVMVLMAGRVEAQGHEVTLRVTEFAFQTNEQNGLITVEGEVSVWNPPALDERNLNISIVDEGETLASAQVSFFEQRENRAAAQFTLPEFDAARWYAGRPKLYELVISLKEGRKTLAETGQPLGFNKVGFSGESLQVNGQAVRLHGVDYFIEENSGVEQWRRDLELMKQGNINLVYTPEGLPPRGFLSLCDGMGIYVVAQVDPMNFEAQAGRALLHPCVLLWVVDGAVPQDFYNELVAMAKRPVLPMVEPGSLSRLPSGAIAVRRPFIEDANDLASFNKPVLLLSTLSAEGMKVEGLLELSKLLFEDNAICGLSVEAFADRVDYAVGIVNQDRTPAPDFFMIQKAFAPVGFEQDVVQTRAGRDVIEVDIANRMNVTNLREMNCRWWLEQDGKQGETQSILFDLPPGEGMEAAFPVTLPEDFEDHVWTIGFSVESQDGLLLQQNKVRLQPRFWEQALITRLDDLPFDKDWTVRGQLEQVEISHELSVFESGVNPLSWFMRTAKRNVRLITGGPFFYVEPRAEIEAATGAIKEIMYEDLWVKRRAVNRVGDEIEITSPVSVRSATQPFNAQVNVLSSPFGYIDVRYEMESDFPLSEIHQAGLGFETPLTLDRVTWVGRGPFPVYPGLEHLAEWGVYQLGLDWFYEGNRADIQTLVLSNAQGYGVAVMMLNGDISVEPMERVTRVKIQGAVSGTGSGLEISRWSAERYRDDETVKARFRIMPLVEGKPEWIDNLINQN